MKAVKLLLIGVALWAGNRGSAYEVKAEYVTQPSRPGAPVTVRFSLFEDGASTPLTTDHLKLDHEKFVHLMMLDAGFQTYVHEHPVEVSPGVWELTFEVGHSGKYRTWLQFRPKTEETTQTVFFDKDIVHCPSEVVPTSPVDTSVNLVGQDGPYRVTLSFPDGAPKQHTNVTAQFAVEKDGVAVPFSDLSTYLGSKLHLVGASADRNDFVHAHHHPPPPAFDAADDSLPVHFMQPGYYALYGQFLHEGVRRTVKFGVVVNPMQH